MLEMSPPDMYGRYRVPLPRGLGKAFKLTITGKYIVPPQTSRTRLGLPRPLGLIGQGSQITVQGSESVELLVGAAQLEVPVPEKHRYQFAAPETPAQLDLAWRPFVPEFPVDSVIDVHIRGRTAH